jgi:4-nitrophenyl phosphatase
MDGTFYLGNTLLDGSLDFLKKVQSTGRDFIFFTNNSLKSPAVYMDKLAGMGCYITRQQILTSGDVSIEYLNATYPEKKYIWSEQSSL